MTPERAAQIIRMTPRIFSVDQDKLNNNDRFIAQEDLRDEMMKDAGQLPLNAPMNKVKDRYCYSNVTPKMHVRFEKVIDMHEAGATNTAMAKALGVTRSMIVHDLRYLDLKPNRAPSVTNKVVKRSVLVEARRKEVEALMDGPLTCRAIAEELGATYNAIKHDIDLIRARRRAERDEGKEE